MQGFFNKKDTESPSCVGGKIVSCVRCGLSSKVKTPKMKPFGGFKKGIMNIGSAPSDYDDKKGIPFQHKDYQIYLKKLYADVGIDLYEDCLNVYSVLCASEGINYGNVDNCRKTIFSYIEKYKPKIIVLFGREALYSIIGHRWKKDLGDLEKWQGHTIPDQELNCWIVPTYNVNFVETYKNKVPEIFFKQTLQKVADLTNKELFKYTPPEIIYLKNDLSVLNNIQNQEIVIDFETTGKKPQAEGHRVVCASVAVSENKVYTFLIPPTKEQRQPFLELLKRKHVWKIGQNIKYEDTWAKVRLKTEISSWYYDTMLGAHILDNRPGVVGLKFQTYIILGIIDYDSEIQPYLCSDDNGNSLNSIMKVLESKEKTKTLLTYCANDSINTMRIFKKTKNAYIIPKDSKNLVPNYEQFSKARILFQNGILALAKAERTGLRVDVDYLISKKKELSEKVQKIEQDFKKTEFFIKWQKNSKTTININSDHQLANYLYNVLKIEPKKLTESGKGSTDEESLKLLNIPELNMLLERSKLLKIRDTYLEGFLSEQVNGKIHPFFNLHTVRTFRSSSNNPNFQNIPKRDKEAMNLVRNAIFPTKGNQLMEFDYKGIEVSIAACYHKDPTMIKYITDPKSDMHGDMAKQIFVISDFNKKIPEHSYLRNAAKNGFVFPQFYGDYFKNCADGISSNWTHMPKGKWNDTMGVYINSERTITLGENFLKNGIKKYQDFVDHLERIEQDFWENRFPVYAEWKERHYKSYLRKGYVELYSGFVCKGLMSKNDVINYPVQGAAFHVLLWTLTECTKEFEKRGLNTKVVGQIHDAIVLDVFPPELNEVYSIVQEIGTKKVLEYFPWIIVPLTIEAELCPIDGSWATKKEFELI